MKNDLEVKEFNLIVLYVNRPQLSQNFQGGWKVIQRIQLTHI